MKILAIIPARGGSKGVPLKNIKLLNKKPLLQYTSNVALRSKLLSKVILSTDDEAIISVGKKLGIEVPFLRPTNLAKDSSPTLPVIQHALTYLNDNLNEEYEAVCLLQVTSPFRTVEFLDAAIRKFIKCKADSLISVQKVPHEFNPHWTFEKDQNDYLKIATGDKKLIPRRQDLPDTYHRDGSIYITKVSTIFDQNSLYGNKIAYIESPKEHYVNIDTEDDWKKAELMASRLKKF